MAAPKIEQKIETETKKIGFNLNAKPWTPSFAQKT